MTQDIEFVTQVKELIDDLKSVCANYGLGNDGNEFKIITQMFLYKYLNDRFLYEVKIQNSNMAAAENIQAALEEMSEDDYFLMAALVEGATLKPHQLITHLFQNQNQDDFAKLFDDTLREISTDNTDIYSIKSATGAKDLIFDELSNFISDASQRDAFCKALINKTVEFSFEKMFGQTYDFFATIFEYLIKDYNSDSGGKYAEYYTPHAVARVMGNILVDEPTQNVTIYDPSAGSGTLLMSLAHVIGPDRCTIYSEDISQKSSDMMRLNLIINGLSHSISHVIKTNTISDPYYFDKKFDFIVSNPPFKLDFSDYRDDLEKDAFKKRFFAGLPNIPKKNKASMSIFLLFIQHIMYSLSDKGRAAIVVPTGFITAQSRIEKKIRKQLIDKGWLTGVVSMPSNIFASTGTNVSVLFLDKKADSDHIVLLDASSMGTKVKEGNRQRTVLSEKEEKFIIDTFREKEETEDFSVIVSKDEIQEKNYSLSAGQYFEIKIEYVDITPEEFDEKLQGFENRLNDLFEESDRLDQEIKENFKTLKFL